MVIGLTILAYRYQGLRQTDFFHVLKTLRSRMFKEGGPYPKRRSCKQFSEWVRAAGGRVRGEKRDDKQRSPSVDFRSAFAAPAVETVEDDNEKNIWPLRLVCCVLYTCILTKTHTHAHCTPTQVDVHD